MEHIYDRIKGNSYGTKRELYYNNTQFFETQIIVDNIISQLELILGCCRLSFHISPTPKGQMFGTLILKIGGIEINYANYNSSHGQLMPCADDDIQIVSCTAKFILVVEKDTIFHRLLSEYCDKVLGSLIIMTSKGYPDFNSRMLLRMLTENLHLPILYFGDCDPFGIDIYTQYAFGSNLNCSNSILMHAPYMKWIGLEFDMAMQVAEGAKITDGDYKKAHLILNKPYMSIDSIKLIRLAWAARVREKRDSKD